MPNILTLETKKYSIKIDNFEGPLDLLIYLIEKNKMDIYDINLTEITEQYIEYLKAMDLERFYELAEPYIRRTVTKDFDLKRIAALVKTRIEILPDICEQIDFFEKVPEYDNELYTHKKMKTDPEKGLALLREVIPLLEEQQDYSNDALFEMLKGFAEEKGYKIGYVMWPLRTAVSGKQNTPGGATELIEVLGKEESLNRIRKGIEKLS